MLEQPAADAGEATGLMLERVEPGSVVEVTTEVPTFVMCRDRLTPLVALVHWLEEAGRDRVLLIDSASSYPPLLDYFGSCSYPVYRCTDNVGNRSPWAPWARAPR